MATVGGISGRRNEGKRGTRAGGGGRKATGEERPGKRRQGRGIYYQGFTVITRRGRSTRAARGVAYVCGVVRLSDAQTSVYVYICIYVCSQNIHGRVHVTWISWIRKLDVPRLLATAVCPTSALCRVSMHYALRNWTAPTYFALHFNSPPAIIPGTNFIRLLFRMGIKGRNKRWFVSVGRISNRSFQVKIFNRWRREWDVSIRSWD